MIQFYKPNSKNTGGALGMAWSMSDDDPSIYVTFVKQFSWDDKNKTGSFKENAKEPGKNLTVKFSLTEIGGMIEAIERRTEFKAFHKFKDDQTQISMTYYNDNKGNKNLSFGAISNTTNKFGVGLTLGEAVVVREFLRKSLHRAMHNASIARKK